MQAYPCRDVIVYGHFALPHNCCVVPSHLPIPCLYLCACTSASVCSSAGGRAYVPIAHGLCFSPVYCPSCISSIRLACLRGSARLLLRALHAQCKLAVLLSCVPRRPPVVDKFCVPLTRRILSSLVFRFGSFRALPGRPDFLASHSRISMRVLVSGGSLQLPHARFLV